MKVLKLMHKNPKVVCPDDTILEAAQVMQSIGAGVLPVVENGQIIGMVTDRDITIRATARGKDPYKATVRDVMTEDALCCYEDEDVKKAGERMLSNRVGRMPVLSRRGLALSGILSLADIIARRGGKKLIKGSRFSGLALPAMIAFTAIGMIAGNRLSK